MWYKPDSTWAMVSIQAAYWYQLQYYSMFLNLHHSLVDLPIDNVDYV